MPPSSRKPSAKPAHLDARGRAWMVNVGGKPETDRLAVATAAVRMRRETLAVVRAGKAGARPGRPGSGKGDVLAVARVAALQAVKRAWEIIPLCHPVRVVAAEADVTLDDRLPGVRVRVAVRALDRTGVEMEALVGASAGALTVYDMVKAHERGVEIRAVRLEEKSGGASGIWRRGGRAAKT